MNIRECLIPLLALCATCLLPARAADIPVINAGFEQPDLGGVANTTRNWNNQDGSGVNVITGWTYDYVAQAWPSANDSGVWNGLRDGVSPIEGLNMAYLRHSAGQAAEQATGPWQDLGYPIVAGETYQFSITVQRRQSGTAMSLTFNAHNAGTRSLIARELIDMTTQPDSSWATYAVVFTAQAGDPFIGHSLGIEFNNESSTDSWQHFDDVKVVTLDIPRIVTAPQPQQVQLGDTNAVVAFSATVEGQEPLSYSWTFEGTPLVGETNASLVISNAGPDDTGAYVLTASNVFDAVSSAPAMLSLTAGPVQPGDMSAHEGRTAQFGIVMPEDSSGYTYQWRKDASPLAGETGPTLALSPVQAGDTGVYDVEVTLGPDAALSSPATLAVLPLGPAFVLLDDFESHIPGDPINNANGWQAFGGAPDGIVTEDPADSRNHAARLGANANNEGYQLPLGANTVADGTVATVFFRLRTTAAISAYLVEGDTLLSNAWWGVDEVGVYNRAPSIGEVMRGHWDSGLEIPFPNDTWYNVWLVIDNSVTPSSAGGESYDVYVGQGADDAASPALAMVPTRKFSVNVGDLDHFAFLSNDGTGGGYIDDVYVANGGINLIYPGPQTAAFIAASPEDQTVVLGDTNAVVTFSATVAGTPPLAYAWSRGGVPIPGATNVSLVISNAGPADVGTYTVTAGNAMGTDTSAPATLAVVSGPVTPAGLTTLVGDNATLTVTMPMDSTGYIYQWKLDGIDIPGATDAALSFIDMQASNSGAYTVAITLGPDAVTSDPVTITVVPLPTSTYANLITAANPTIWWRLGDLAGASVAVDQLTFNDADVLADTVLGAPGALLGDSDTAAHFPGTADSKVELFNSGDAATSPFSVEFWAVLEGGSGFRSPITSRDVFEGNIYGWTFYVTDADAWQFRIGDGGPAWAGVIDGFPAAPGAWTHVVGTYDGSTMRLYLDGALAGAETVPGYQSQNFNPLWIGAGTTEDVSGIGNFFWMGRIDEVALYDRAISPGEVATHWAGAFQPGTAPEIIGHPQFAWALPGGATSFQVTARGTPLVTYQWKKDGVDIPGATSATLELIGVADADNGMYACAVSNAGGGVTSTAAELFVPGPLAGTYQNLVLGMGPELYWPMDETTGTVALDLGGANPGAYRNGVTLGLPGAIGGEAGNRAPSFDGVNDFVAGPAGFLSARSNMTLVGWVRPLADQTARTGLFGQNEVMELGFIDAGNVLAWSPSTGELGFAHDFQIGEWHHIAVVGSVDRATLYVDGVNVATVAGPFTDFGTNSAPFNAGGGGIYDAAGNSFEGQLDEVAVFGTALSEKEIVQLFAGGAATVTPPATMGISTSAGNIVVTWDGATGVLQAAPSPSDSWNDVSGAASPYNVGQPVEPQMNYRLREP